jgi:uncharacterized PurR-regulated membrane protein YhhQ (DUF165 family)
MNKIFGWFAVTLFIATVFVANWSIKEFGVISVGFGLSAPAGVFAVGIAFTARDLIHETLGKWYVPPAILVGAALSWWLEAGVTIPGGVVPLAVASGIAFLVAEGLDFAIYTPLRARGWLKAVATSNVVGLVADSALFLYLAFGSLDFLSGQVVAKGYMTVAAIAVIWIARRVVLSRNSHTFMAR